MRYLEQAWYRSSLTILTTLLLPLSWLFRIVVRGRYLLYQTGLKKSVTFPVPVIVVGNITVGGTGKTPFVIWLANWLKDQGYQPGIIARGVGGKKWTTPQWVKSHSDPHEVGDEAVLLAKRTGCPTVVCRNRVESVHELLTQTNCDVIVSDDGLQHYSLGRTLEILLIDSVRQFGNQKMLPAGPLREPISRINRVDLVLQKEKDLSIEIDQFVSVASDSMTRSINSFKGQRVHAIAGIGNPDTFFNLLKNNGIFIIPHVFPDHYLFEPTDIQFEDELPILMTEKDATKCFKFAGVKHWFLPITLSVDKPTQQRISDLIAKLPQS